MGTTEKRPTRRADEGKSKCQTFSVCVWESGDVDAVRVQSFQTAATTFRPKEE
jgi:hypothetical protein